MKISRSLVLSVALNVLLAAGWAMTGLWPTKRAVTPVAVAAVRPVEAIRPTPAPVVVEKPWDWANVESEDYRDYMRNLRAVRCPEETIRDIITADVAGLFRQRRQEMQGTGYSESALRREEKALLAALLGTTPAGDGSGTVAKGASSPQGRASTAGRGAGANGSPKETVVAMPVALRDPTPAQNFNSQQMAQLQRLRDNFVAEVGGTSQDPNDPDYLRRWTEAQPRFDQQFKALFGARAFQEQQQAQAAPVASATSNGSQGGAGGASSPAAGTGTGSGAGQGNGGGTASAPARSSAIPTGAPPRFDRQVKTDFGYTFR